MTEAMDQSTVDGDVVCEIETVQKCLEICWCEEKCLIDKGSYGRVYKGKWKVTTEESKSINVAVKHPEAGPYHVEYEIKALEKVNGHRNILTFYGQIKYGPNSLIVTELCNGTLHDLIVIKKDSLTPLSSHKLRDVVLHQIVEGVKHLHDNNILHRDLKPRNILYYLMNEQLVMKLADFGCSRSVPDDTTHYTRSVLQSSYSQHFRPFGTDGWLAPEVLNGETHLRPPIDIYPLGLIFAFTLCRGQHPYGEDANARDTRMKNKEPMLENIRQKLIDEYGDGCYNLIDRMLDPNPVKRPTASQVLEDAFLPTAADILDDDYFPGQNIVRDSKKENELLRLCDLERLEGNNLTRFIQLVNDKKAVNVNCTDKKGRTPLMLLCEYNETDSLYNCVEILLRERPDIDVNHTDKMGTNALMWLCLKSESDKIVEVAQLLIAKGIDLKQTSLNGLNALMWLCALSKNDKIVEVVQLLIDNGVDEKHTNNNGINALMLLCDNSKNDKIVEVAQLLIAKAIDLNQTDENGMNALMQLCARSKNDKIVEVAQLLIAKAIDLNQTHVNGDNALMLLCYNSINEKIVEVAQLLIAKGIDLKQTDVNGLNALMQLCARSKNEKIVEVAQLLIDSGVDLKQTDVDGDDAIYYLMKNSLTTDSNRTAIVKLLEQ